MSPSQLRTPCGAPCDREVRAMVSAFSCCTIPLSDRSRIGNIRQDLRGQSPARNTLRRQGGHRAHTPGAGTTGGVALPRSGRRPSTPSGRLAANRQVRSSYGPRVCGGGPAWPVWLPQKNSDPAARASEAAAQQRRYPLPHRTANPKAARHPGDRYCALQPSSPAPREPGYRPASCKAITMSMFVFYASGVSAARSALDLQRARLGTSTDARLEYSQRPGARRFGSGNSLRGI